MFDITFCRDSATKAWRVSGPIERMKPGADVLVTKRNGETTPVHIGTVQWQNAITAICDFEWVTYEE